MLLHSSSVSSEIDTIYGVRGKKGGDSHSNPVGVKIAGVSKEKEYFPAVQPALVQGDHK